MAIADELADLPLQVMSHFFLGLTYVYVCRFREAIEAYSWNVDRLQGESIYERFGEPGLPAVFSRSYLMRALAEVGCFTEGLTRGDEAVRLSEPTDLLFSLASSLEGLGYVHLRRGEIPQAIAILERSLRICEQRQFYLIQYMVQGYLGYAYALAGRDVEAAPLLAESAMVDWGLHPCLRVTMQGEAHLLAGRLDQARECVDRALALAAVSEERGNQGWTLRLAAEIVSGEVPDGTRQAIAKYQEGLEIANEHGMRPLQAHCHLGLGKVYGESGHLDDARRELSTAVNVYRSMGMAFWLPEAEAELARLE
jgi:tetratricopeptide (TPR) repeat protein